MDDTGAARTTASRAARSSSTGVLAFVAAASWFATAAPAQVQWTREPLFPRASDPIAFDFGRGRLVRFGSGSDGREPETWEWDRTAWRLRAPATSPPLRSEHALVCDLVRGRIVLFGGMRGLRQLFSDTWEWDGVNWVERSPATAPPARRLHAMAFDLVRGRTVLFGGLDTVSGLRFDDTWEFDGTNWSLVVPASRPPGRAQHAMAFASGSLRTVLFGGYGTSHELGDTWTFDGTNWTLATPAQSPSPRRLHGMAGDLATGRVVLFGGDAVGVIPSVRFGDTWEWDGAQWNLLAASGALGPRTSASLGFDVQLGVLAAGGELPLGVPQGQIWRLASQQWTPLVAAEGPLGRQHHALAFDPLRGRLVVFSGTSSNALLDDHWECDGARWHEHIGTRPPAREGSEMVFDAARGRCVLFGGFTGVTWLADLWELDASGWRQRAVAGAPPARRFHAMAFDAARDRVLLFGGANSQADFGDTWEWDGTSWTQRTPATTPSPRRLHAMAFDAARQVVLLYGGIGPLIPSSDTWRWNGADWSLLVSQSAPGPLEDHALVDDPARGRVVLLGAPAPGPMLEAWDWDGTTWTQRSAAIEPLRRLAHAAAYDHLRERITMFGGVAAGTWFPDLWHFAPTHGARSVPFGSACSGSAGAWTLAAQDGARPWLGDPVTLRAAPVPAPGVALFVLGVSRTTWNGAPLPRALDALGMPGCAQYVSIDATAFTTASGGAATFALAIPNQPSLLGLEVFAQSVALDPAANAFGAVTSNALALRVGGR